MTDLKIENGKGFFLNEKGEMQQIHEIRKEDILKMLDLATDNNIDFEMDEIIDGSIQNEAHKIIYSELYRKFKELLDNKDKFLDESESLYKDALDKYREKQ